MRWTGEKPSTGIQEAARLARGLAADLDLRHRHPSGLDLEPHGSKVTFRLDLSPGADAVWANLDAKVRNQVRKAQKSGLVVEWAGGAGLEVQFQRAVAHALDLLHVMSNLFEHQP